MTSETTWPSRQRELTPSVDQLMRRPWVENTVGLVERQLRTLEERGLFPRRVPIVPGGHAVGWSKLEILQWVRDRLAARDELKAAERYDAMAEEAEAGEDSEDEEDDDEEE
jgi:predicted DNA-binding transcriptional regulator AlpA